jgi:hypothetical protein
MGRGQGSGGSREQVLTINGRPQPQPEGTGTGHRQFRLFVECMSRLRADPLASDQASSQPVGDGCGLQGLVARIGPLFTNERSLIRWVALRGAFTSLFVYIFDPSSKVASLRDLEQAMGVALVAGPTGDRHLEVAESWTSRLSTEQQANVVAIARQVLFHVSDYPRLQSLSVLQVNSDPELAEFDDALALDCIVWSAIALLRLGIGPGPRALIMAPEPDALLRPGWYPEPLWGRAERYWDGSDWTAVCRVRNGRNATETSMPLR